MLYNGENLSPFSIWRNIDFASKVLKCYFSEIHVTLIAKATNLQHGVSYTILNGTK
jgi:hypothetical protein